MYCGWDMLVCVQLPGVKAKVFSEEYDLKEVGAFQYLNIDCNVKII